ncbi:SEC-C metal-binding domain-containing protein [Paenibacillus sp. Marseille-Q4541]|uniref:YecA family protein n=1 Tax=Paenibacillus sp. Marseille-Q4541 TaxID=2831522 RepID=UPI00201844DD|nr:SEC-C metal-binding domain-containing protein [Paenibacillus sp. Marseille-Q4541]
MTNIGRNEPCHCGSGKKYKKCCLEKDKEQQRNVRVATSVEVVTGSRRAVSTTAQTAKVVPETSSSVAASSVPSTDKELDLTELPWENETHRELAASIIPELAKEYALSYDQQAQLAKLWSDYSQSEAPRYRKPGGYAGALEYLIATKLGKTVSQAELAAKHDVSATTLSKCANQLAEFSDNKSFALQTV